MQDPENVIIPPVTDELDLHAFRPAEVAELLKEYFLECGKLGIYRVRIVHGKGTGALRERVHQLLRSAPEVESFTLAGPDAGGWGATWAVLKKDGS